MAAIRTGVTPVCLARCFLRPGGKPSRGRQPLSDIWEHRSLQRSHLHTMFECRTSSTRTLLSRRHHGKFLWVNTVAVRHNSTQISAEAASFAAPLADGPVHSPVLDMLSTVVSADPTPVLTQSVNEQVVDIAPTALEVLQTVGAEQRLAELGLAGHTPVGLIQNLLEFMHMDLGLPWWGAIVAGNGNSTATVLARLALFPVRVKCQREAVKLNNVLPEMNNFISRLNEAKLSGNELEISKASAELKMFQKKNDVNPLRGFLVSLVQAPVFISFFIALRKMAYLPVPSLQTGGALWFPDLSVADPFYILPLAVTGTMFFIIELGAESGVDNSNLGAMKTVFRIMTLLILPLTINFPTAVFTYWLTSNCFSLAQVALLRHPKVRERFRIPEKIKHPPNAVPQNDGLIESMKKVNKQSDAAEYFEKILMRTSTEASRIFQGKLEHMTVCLHCDAKTSENGPFWHLPLTLPLTDSCSVSRGIEEFFKKSELRGENQLYCDRCHGKWDSTVMIQTPEKCLPTALLVRKTTSAVKTDACKLDSQPKANTTVKTGGCVAASEDVRISTTISSLTTRNDRENQSDDPNSKSEVGKS